MTRILLCAVLALAFPLSAGAAELPSGQSIIGADQVLRGHFLQQSQIPGVAEPTQSIGHFLIAPSHGLIWSIEKPIPTSTIITAHGSVQDLGGIVLKLKIKNLQHLYNMIGAALAGDWSGLETDYSMTRSANAGHWNIVLTPRPDHKPALSYSSITISGGPFVENITLLKPDGTSDMLNFTDEVLARLPLAPFEDVAFHEVSP